MRPVSRVADDFTRSAEDEDEHRWKLAPGHPLHFQISEPGSHVLWVDLHRNTEKEGPRNATLVKDGLDFTITEPANAGEEQVVRVTCTNEMVQAALRELDGR
jgi:hypothetical protein